MQQTWTNESVQKLAGAHDPINTLLEKLREYLFEAIENGFSGPPFNPIELADYLDIDIVPSTNIPDARVLMSEKGKFWIEFNPTRPKNRINFSIAHEIVHTFFPDCGDYIRNRSNKRSISSKDWELELLCNLGAAEILMPTGSFAGLKDTVITIDNILKLRKDFNVSVEAVLRRIVSLSEKSFFVFSASSIHEKSSSYKIEYLFNSRRNDTKVNRGYILPENSIISHCTAIGYTVVGNETWIKDEPELHIECVGLPPYPGSLTPRVVGIGYPINHEINQNFIRLKYITGNVLVPHGSGTKIIAHVVNDTANKWGGRGVARAVAEKWPEVFKDFAKWRKHNYFENFELGCSRLYQVDEDLFVFSMIAQHGYKESLKPKIRYAALEQCLHTLAKAAQDTNATVHLPKIGTGYGQGEWSLISEMLDRTLLTSNIDTTVYIYPRNHP